MELAPSVLVIFASGKKGFEILQNIDDQMTVSKSNIRTTDRLTSRTKYEEIMTEDISNKKEIDEENNLQDIAFFCQDEDDEKDIDTIIEESNWTYSHTSLITQSNANSDRVVEARQYSGASLVLKNSSNNIPDNLPTRSSDEQSNQRNNSRKDQLLWDRINGFETIMKLVSGSILGGECFADVYTDVNNDADYEKDADFRTIDIDSKSFKSHE